MDTEVLIKLMEARRLLILCAPYIENHYKMSKAGFGMYALELLKEIQEFISIIERDYKD